MSSKVRQWWQWKSIELDRDLNQSYTTTSHSLAMKCLALEGHEFEGQGHGQHFSQMHFSDEGISVDIHRRRLSSLIFYRLNRPTNNYRWLSVSWCALVSGEFQTRCDYESIEADELSFKKDQKVEVLEARLDGWWKVKWVNSCVCRQLAM